MIKAGKGAKHEVVEFHLNRNQALLTCILSRTPKGREIRAEVRIGAFGACANRQRAIPARPSAGPFSMSQHTASTFDFNALIEGVQCSHKVRVVTVESAPWFVLADVARVLGLKEHKTRGGFSYHAERFSPGVERRRELLPTIQTGGDGEGRKWFTTLSEAGLYKLIMRSDKPLAKPFQDWVTREVLPSIRRTGGYKLGAGETMPLPGSFPQRPSMVCTRGVRTLAPSSGSHQHCA